MDNWLSLETVWWIMRIGIPWQKLPAGPGDLHTTYTRFKGRGASGRWRMILEAARGNEDWEVGMIDGAVVRPPGTLDSSSPFCSRC